MNLTLIKRVYNRLKYINDSSAYVTIVQYISGLKYVWKATQWEIASWWERRQNAEIEMEVVERGHLRITCPLEGSVIEVDGQDLRVPPFEISVPLDLPIGKISITHNYNLGYIKFFEELLGHFGYRHIKPVTSGQRVDIYSDELKDIINKMRLNAIDHWRYQNEDIIKFRNIIKKAHNTKGLPELRIWPLPHDNKVIFKVAVSPRFDVDKAIINLPEINQLEQQYGVKSTVYLRPLGYFYGNHEIKQYKRLNMGTSEIALHGEFITTSERFLIDEFQAAKHEKRILEDMISEQVKGVCMHGGELRYNVSKNTWKAIEEAGFEYETMYRNGYYLPLHLPNNGGVRRTLSIGQHFSDVEATVGPEFTESLTKRFEYHFSEARKVGGIVVPVMHPLYFNFSNYIMRPTNIMRLLKFIPKYAATVIRMKKGQIYSNVDK